MNKWARIVSKMKKGFTLVEVIVVLGLIALATAIAIPNLRGATTRAEMDTYRSYCLQAKEDVKMCLNLLNSGDTLFTITSDNYKVSTVSLTIPSGLTKALNSVNRQPKYQYYVIDFSTAETDPSASISTASGLKADVDIIVPVIIYNDASKTYELRGLWYYSMGKGRVMLTFTKSNHDYEGYQSLASTTK